MQLGQLGSPLPDTCNLGEITSASGETGSWFLPNGPFVILCLRGFINLFACLFI